MFAVTDVADIGVADCGATQLECRVSGVRAGDAAVAAT